MSTDSVEAETAADIYCASCGTAQVDDIKLTMMLVISFIIAAIIVSRIICRITKQGAKKGRLNYVTRFYLGNLKAHITATAPSVVCRFRLIQINPI